MVKDEKEHGFMEVIKDGLSYISTIISSSIFPQITEGTEMVMKTIDDRIQKMEKRILRKIYSSIIILFGLLFLILALFFLLTDYLGWSKAVALFSIGIIILIIGLLSKIREPDK